MSKNGIAIIGMNCRFPGGSNSNEEFWQNLVTGKDCISEVPTSRWNTEAFFDSNPDSIGKMYTRWGGFLDCSISSFDAAFFNISPPEAIAMDPQQRLFLEVTWEALENGAINPIRLRKKQVGVFVGAWSRDYAALVAPRPNSINTYSVVGHSSSLIAGRVSYFLDLKGPALLIDSSSSSSLVAIHQACQSIRDGECEMAIAGGVNLIINPDITIGFCKSRTQAIDGRCKAFDEGANGYVRGEGVGVVVLKPLDRAVEDGDKIFGVIKATAINQDGHSGSIMAPDEESQRQCMKRALKKIDLDPSTIAYVEAHGTGTPLGDPIEIRSISSVYGDSRSDSLIVGSVKSNIGHLESAAGIAGLIKTILCLEKKIVPANLHLKVPNPNLNLQAGKIELADTTRDLSHKENFLAAVNSFGFSGTNAHVIVQAYTSSDTIHFEHCDNKSLLVTLSARDEKALRELAHKYVSFFNKNNNLPIQDVSFTSLAGRAHFNERLAIVCSSVPNLIDKLKAFLDNRPLVAGARGCVSFSESLNDKTWNLTSEGEVGLLAGLSDLERIPSEKSTPRSPAFLFTGQGSQYVGMTAQLFETNEVFRQSIQQCAKIVNGLLPIKLEDLLYKNEHSETLAKSTVYTQTALCAIEYSIAQTWISWGISPEALMGHSMGEYVAACLAEVFSLEDMFRLVIGRVKLMESLCPQGAMAAVNLDIEQCKILVLGKEDKISIAVDNGPGNTVISGDRETIQSTVKRLEEAGTKVKLLAINWASHSPLVEKMLSDYGSLTATIKYALPKIPIISNLYGRQVGSGEIDSEYWCHHLRATVRFAEGMRCLLANGFRSFIECGPGTTLLGMGQNCTQADSGLIWIPSIKKERVDSELMLEGIAVLYANGIISDIDENSRFVVKGRRCSLPTYAFQRKDYWLDNAADSFTPYGSSASDSPLERTITSPAFEGTIVETISPPANVPNSWIDWAGAHRFSWSHSLRKIVEELSDQKIPQEQYSMVVEANPPISLEKSSKVRSHLVMRNKPHLEFQLYTQLIEESRNWTMSAKGEVHSIQSTPQNALINANVLRSEYSEEWFPIELQKLKEHGMWTDVFPKCVNKIWLSKQGGIFQINSSFLENFDSFHKISILLDVTCILFSMLAKKNESLLQERPLFFKHLQFDRLSVISMDFLWVRTALKSSNDEEMIGSIQFIGGEGQVLTSCTATTQPLPSISIAAYPIQVEENDEPEVIRIFRDTMEVEQDELIRKFLLAEISSLLGTEDCSRISHSQSLKNQGIDSLLSIELRKRINRNLKGRIEIPQSLVIDYPNINSLVEFLRSRMATFVAESLAA